MLLKELEKRHFFPQVNSDLVCRIGKRFIFPTAVYERAEQFAIKLAKFVEVDRRIFQFIPDVMEVRPKQDLGISLASLVWELWL